MRFITWNCQGALRRKLDVVLSLNPDVLVVQECERPEKVLTNLKGPGPVDCIWYGENDHKGIGIFTFSNFRLDLLCDVNPAFRYVIPLKVVRGERIQYLFAIWAMNNKLARNARYIGQVWLAINYYESLLGSSTLLMGDFNSNKIWDEKERIANHTTVVKMLEAKGISSMYHEFYKANQGVEMHPTFFLQHNRKKPYHIDYCFASADLAKQLTSVELGRYDDWNIYSDHCPLVVDFNV